MLFYRIYLTVFLSSAVLQDSGVGVGGAPAALSFPAGSVSGPDGLRPQHLRDLLLSSESGPDLLSASTAFANLMLAGGCQARVAPIFFGGRLLALDKKSGGIRPIAIGFTLR